jgi:hypothetical protein
MRAPSDLLATVLVALFAVGCAAAQPPAAAVAAPPQPKRDPHSAPKYQAFNKLDKRDAILLDSGLNDVDRLALIDADATATQCTDVLARAQWEQDTWNVASAQAHYDNCTIDASTAYLRAQLAEAEKQAKAGDAYKALAALGRAAHSLQDFFIHTNYVELVAAQYGRLDDVPVLELWNPQSDAELTSLKAKGLLSGTVFWESGQCPAGTPSHEAVNKDDDEKSTQGRKVIEAWGCTHYRAAYELARRATARMLRGRLSKSETIKLRCGSKFGFGMTFDRRKP